MFSCSSRRLIFRPGNILFSFRSYSNNIKSTSPPQIAKKTWKLPEIDSNGNPVEPDPDQKIIELGNKLGLFVDDRPRVPPQWRKRTDLPEWRRQTYALREKFYGQTWNPPKRLSRAAMQGVRYLKSISPETTNTELAREFQISPEAIRRILKSKWQPTEEELEKVEQRWQRRGQKLRQKRRSQGKSSGRVEMDLPDKSEKKKGKKKKSSSNSRILRDLGNDTF